MATLVLACVFTQIGMLRCKMPTTNQGTLWVVVDTGSNQTKFLANKDAKVVLSSGKHFSMRDTPGANGALNQYNDVQPTEPIQGVIGQDTLRRFKKMDLDLKTKTITLSR